MIYVCGWCRHCVLVARGAPQSLAPSISLHAPPPLAPPAVRRSRRRFAINHRPSSRPRPPPTRRARAGHRAAIVRAISVTTRTPLVGEIVSRLSARCTATVARTVCRRQSPRSRSARHAHTRPSSPRGIFTRPAEYDVSKTNAIRPI